MWRHEVGQEADHAVKLGVCDTAELVEVCVSNAQQVPGATTHRRRFHKILPHSQGSRNVPGRQHFAGSLHEGLDDVTAPFVNLQPDVGVLRKLSGLAGLRLAVEVLHEKGRVTGKCKQVSLELTFLPRHVQRLNVTFFEDLLLPVGSLQWLPHGEVLEAVLGVPSVHMLPEGCHPILLNDTRFNDRQLCCRDLAVFQEVAGPARVVAQHVPGIHCHCGVAGSGSEGAICLRGRRKQNHSTPTLEHEIVSSQSVLECQHLEEQNLLHPGHR